MFLPPGYANIQYIMNDLRSQVALTAIGVKLVSAVPADVLTGAVTAFDTHLAPIVCDEWGGTDVKLVLGTSNPSAPLVFNYGTWDGGDNVSDPMPPNVAYLVKKITGLGGRKGRGRMFLPGVARGGINSDGTLSTSNLADLNTRVEDFREAIRSITGVEETYLFHSSSLDDPTEITQLVVDPLVATQRRRLRD